MDRRNRLRISQLSRLLTRLCFYVLLFSFFTPDCLNTQLFSRQLTDEKFRVHEQSEKSLTRSPAAIQSVGSPWFDVSYYKLDLHIYPSSSSIEGSVRITGRCNQDQPQFLLFDLMNTMGVDSAIVDGRNSTITQQNASLILTLDSVYRPGAVMTATIFYHGTPVGTGLGSFVASVHAGTPWIWSLSEPYGARDWWPCKDTPSDKADSADINITTDSIYKVGSNGILTAVRSNNDGTNTWFWRERYPIATYLISIAITNYSQFSDWFHYTATDSLQILNYVLPESLSVAQQTLPRAVDGLKVFSNLFGPYPFITEKYGHAQFGGDGMEHQTMTSLPSFDEETIIHELAHQWFGDMITCRSWPHLWLNEGFATYCQALFHEKTDGPSSYNLFISTHLQRARAAVGSVFELDTDDVRALFNGPRVYSKGAVVLHMLRHVLGDTLFFRSLHAYANDPTLQYSTATTEDFRRICEQISGSDLGYFFQEWIYGENYPHYNFSWTTRDSTGLTILTLSLSQSTGTLSPEFFTMPIDFKITGTGWDSTVTVFNDATQQSFSFIVPYQVRSVQLDPDNWILKDATGSSDVNLPSSFKLFQNFPNPFNATTQIQYNIQHRMRIRIDVLNVLGITVSTLFDGMQIAGTHILEWDGSRMPSGIYYYRLTAGKFIETRKMTFLK
jgi:aminopeptidase N